MADRDRVNTSTAPHYWPVPRHVVIAFVLLIAAVAILQVALASYAYRRLGIEPAWAYGILLGIHHRQPLQHPNRTPPRRRRYTKRSSSASTGCGTSSRRRHGRIRVLAVNVGGTVIPTVLAVYLIVHASLGWTAVIAIAIVSSIVHLVARVVPGIGIVVPTLVPPVTAVIVAWAADVSAIAAVAYVAGTLGALIGGDLLNLRRLRDLDAPILSIGGGGTFDGIFITGIIAVLLAAL